MATAFIDLLMRANAKPMQKTLKQSQRDVKRYTYLVKREMRGATRALTRFTALGVAGFGALAKAALDSADNIAKSARNAGLAANEFQTLAHAFELSGSSGSALTKATQALARQIFNLSRDSIEAKDAFDAIGLSYSDLVGKSRGDQLRIVLRQLRGLTDESRQAAVAQALLGRAGKELGSVLQTSATDFAQLEARLASLGGVIDPHLLAGAERFNDEITVLSTVIRAQFASGLLKALGYTKNYDDAIRSVGEAAHSLGVGVVNLTKWIAEHRDTFATAIKVYAAYKILSFQLFVFSGKLAKSFIAVALKANAATIAVNGLKLAIRGLLAASVVGALALALGALIEKFVTLGDEVQHTTSALREMGGEAHLQGLRAELAKVTQQIDYINERTREGVYQGVQWAGAPALDYLAMLEEKRAELQQQINTITGAVDESAGMLNIEIVKSFEQGATNAAAILNDDKVKEGFLLGRQRQAAARASATVAPKEPSELAQDFTANIQTSLSQAFRTADFSDIGDLLLTSLHNTFADKMANQLGELLGGVFDNVFSSFGGGGGLLGGLFSFHSGGVVPGRMGQDVTAVLQAGELVLTREQQRALLTGGGQTVNNIQLVGDVDANVRRSLTRLMPDIALGVTSIQRERRLA